MTDNNTKGYQHIVRHLEIFGFGTTSATSLLQVCKELLDNAYEAVRLTPSPEVSIRLSTLSPSLISMDIQDNGCGFTTLNFAESLNVFSSLRGLTNSPSSTQFGRYGCGLSASCIYAMTATGGEVIRIVSKRIHDAHTKIADLTFDRDTGKALAISETEVMLANCSSGTRIRLNLPSGPNLSLAINAIKELMIRYTITTNEPITFNLVSNIDTLMETFSTSQLSQLILKTKYSAATTILFKLMCHRFTLNERVMVDDIHEIQNSEIHTRAILDFRDYDSMEDDGSVACVADLLRYVNSTPLLDFMDEGYTCLLSRAMKAVRWNRYGCALKAGIFIEGSSTLLNNPKWEIILTSEESSTFPLLKRVIFIVDIIGGTVPFTSLRKTAISESPNLGKGITRSIETVMNKLQELRPDIFVSKKEAKVMTLKKCIPLIALAVSKLIQFSPSSVYQSEQLSILGLDPRRGVHEQVIADNVAIKITRAAAISDP